MKVLHRIAHWALMVCVAPAFQVLPVSAQDAWSTNWNTLTNWTKTAAPAQNWQAIACSTDGTNLAAAVCGGGIYTSSDSGVTWSQTSAPIRGWTCIASSADGANLAGTWNQYGAPWSGGVHTSANAGVTWTQTSAPSARWTGIACSADGVKLAAVVNGGGIYTSSNGGATWSKTGAPTQNWRSITSSADGTRLAAVVYDSGAGSFLQPIQAPHGLRPAHLSNGGTALPRLRMEPSCFFFIFRIIT